MKARQEKDVLQAVETLRELKVDLAEAGCKEWSGYVDRAVALLELKPAGRTVHDLTREDLAIIVLFKALVTTVRGGQHERSVDEIKEALDEALLLAAGTLGMNAAVVLAELDLDARYTLAADRYGISDGEDGGRT